MNGILSIFNKKNPLGDDQVRIQQTQEMFKALMKNDSFLVVAVIAQPDNPTQTFKYIKNHKGTDRDTIIILRSLADRIENGTTNLLIES